MKPTKNKRRIDPRYFLNETADRDSRPLEEEQDQVTAQEKKAREKVQSAAKPLQRMATSEVMEVLMTAIGGDEVPAALSKLAGQMAEFSGGQLPGPASPRWPEALGKNNELTDSHLQNRNDGSHSTAKDADLSFEEKKFLIAFAGRPAWHPPGKGFDRVWHARAREDLWGELENFKGAFYERGLGREIEWLNEALPSALEILVDVDPSLAVNLEAVYTFVSHFSAATARLIEASPSRGDKEGMSEFIKHYKNTFKPQLAKLKDELMGSLKDMEPAPEAAQEPAPEPAPEPAVQQKAPQKKGFFSRVKGAFGLEESQALDEIIEQEVRAILSENKS